MGLFDGLIGGAITGYSIGGPWGALVGGVIGAFTGAASDRSASSQKAGQLASGIAQQQGMQQAINAQLGMFNTATGLQEPFRQAGMFETAALEQFVHGGTLGEYIGDKGITKVNVNKPSGKIWATNRTKWEKKSFSDLESIDKEISKVTRKIQFFEANTPGYKGMWLARNAVAARQLGSYLEDLQSQRAKLSIGLATKTRLGGLGNKSEKDIVSTFKDLFLNEGSPVYDFQKKALDKSLAARRISQSGKAIQEEVGLAASEADRKQNVLMQALQMKERIMSGLSSLGANATSSLSSIAANTGAGLAQSYTTGGSGLAQAFANQGAIQGSYYAGQANLYSTIGTGLANYYMMGRQGQPTNSGMSGVFNSSGNTGNGTQYPWLSLRGGNTMPYNNLSLRGSSF